jgi:hypothetical protein
MAGSGQGYRSRRPSVSVSTAPDPSGRSPARPTDFLAPTAAAHPAADAFSQGRCRNPSPTPFALAPR